jgi:dTDP-4-amino-4,6-dideoxygalactose transaminase
VTRNIPFASPSIDEDEIQEVVKTMRYGWITMGQKTFQFEEAIAQYTGAEHAVAVNSCTAALHLSLLASGIGPGDEVITTPFTFAATGNVIVQSGAKPVFADIIPETFNINPERISEAITPKTKAIIPVHYAGLPCDMTAIMDIAKDHNLVVIEDAAHAIGAEYRGKKIGNLGNPTCFSFYSTKNMTTGEGGAITTNDKGFADTIRKLRLHGISKDAWNRYSGGTWRYDIEKCGWKYNTTDIQSSIGIHQLAKLDTFNQVRRSYAALYTRELQNLKKIKTPSVRMADHVCHLYPLLVQKEYRDIFIDELGKKGVFCSVHFIPLHLHSFYQRTYGFKYGDFPIAEGIYEREVSLPLYPKMTEDDVLFVIACIKQYLDEIP